MRPVSGALHRVRIIEENQRHIRITLALHPGFGSRRENAHSPTRFSPHGAPRILGVAQHHSAPPRRRIPCPHHLTRQDLANRSAVACSRSTAAPSRYPLPAAALVRCFDDQSFIESSGNCCSRCCPKATASSQASSCPASHPCSSRPATVPSQPCAAR